MANFIRSPKSSRYWTENELSAFNIRVDTVDPAQFFGGAAVPAPSVSDTVLNNLEMPNGPVDKEDQRFFKYLKAAEDSWTEDSAVYDFTACIMRMLDYDDGDRVIRTRKKTSFIMARERVEAEFDLCVVSGEDYLLVVGEDERSTSSENTEPKLIAQAIAGFYQNNLQRRLSGHPEIPSKFMAGILMIGTTPFFYRIPVTTALIDALISGYFPTEETVVLRCIPSSQEVQCFIAGGMRPVANRRLAFQCFEAFKATLD